MIRYLRRRRQRKYIKRVLEQLRNETLNVPKTDVHFRGCDA